MSLLLLLSGATVTPPGSTFKVTAEWTTGLVGTIGVRLDDGSTTVTARTTSGIVEYPANSGIYVATMTAPSTGTQYQIVFDDGTDFAVQDLTLLDLSLLQFNVAQLNVAGSVSYLGPVAPSGDVTIIQGDDYSASDNRALEWTSDDWPNLTGATITFTIRPRNSEILELTKAGSVVTPTGTAKVRVALTAAETGALSVSGNHRFDIQATLASSRIVTLTTGRLTVLADVT